MNERTGVRFRAALFALAALLLLAAPALASTDGVTEYRALLIGNSSYQTQTDLPSCAYDLTAMKAALGSGSVRYKKVSAKSNLTKSGIQSAVGGVAGWGADEDDVTVFYYTGHGASSGLVGVEHGPSKDGSFKDGIYSFSQLQSALSKVPGKVIVLLDSCWSGALINKSAASSASSASSDNSDSAKGTEGADGFTDGAIAAFSGAPGALSAKAITSGSKFHVIASSSQTQPSWATDLYGLSTWALCEAMGWSHNGPKAGNKLESLKGDENKDLTVTVGEAFAYASRAVDEESVKHEIVQDMKVYPENSGLMLISRSPVVETPKAIYKSGVLNFSTACIAPGKTLQLTLNVPGATQVHWSTSKSAVAKVDGDTGLVTGVKYSAVVPRISVTYFVGPDSFYAYCDVRVLQARYVVDTVKLKYSEKTLKKRSSYTMPVKVLPASARYKKLRWSSSDNTVATVTSGGKITAVAESGTATITALSTSGVFATVNVTAVPATAKSVSLNYKKRTLIPGRTFTLTHTVLPAYAADRTVTWKSSKPSVADVDTTGLVTTYKSGKAVISATTKNGKRAACTVTVVPNQSVPRTKPKSASGKLIASARKIYYNGTGSLVIRMYFSNRTGYTQKVPMYTTGVVALKLKNKSVVPIPVTVADAKSLRSGRWTLYTFKLNFEDYPGLALAKQDLRGSDATYEAVN